MKLTAKRVQALIKKAGSGRELARRAGVSPGSMSKWRHEGVSEEYGALLLAATRRAPTKPQYEPRKKLIRTIKRSVKTSRERELEERIEELESELEGYADISEFSSVVTFDVIIQFYRDLQQAPEFVDAKSMAEDFDMTIKEVYEAYYEDD